MKRLFFVAVAFAVVFGFSVRAHADLSLLGQGTSAYGTYNLFYDSYFDITWYDYTHTPDIWANQKDWADALSVTFGTNTYTDWRLPSAWNQDGSGLCQGYYCTDSEMGHLYYVDIGSEGAVPYPVYGTSDFQNLPDVEGWPDDPGNIWFGDATMRFNWYWGGQYSSTHDQSWGAIAVRNGLAVVPEPISSTLFIVGGATLGLRRFWNKYKR